MVHEEGNTRPPLKSAIEKPKRISPSNSWCFVHNNYGPDDMDQMVQVFELHDVNYVIGYEIGKSGTPHLQGWVASKIKTYKFRPMELFNKDLPFKVHYEKCRKSEQTNINYCSKDKDFRTNVPHRIDREVEYEEPYGWMLEALELLKEPPHPRQIHWFKGKPGMGKSDFCRYLAVKHWAQICGGKPADMKCQIAKCDYKPDLIIFDVPLENYGYIKYSGLEELKNGVFASPKYESGMCILPRRPHLWVFSNQLPQYEKLAADKLVVHDLDEADHGGVPPPDHLPG